MFGDSIGALQSMTSLKGGGPCISMAQEIAWRRAARRWAPIPLHKPSELNTLADALSRTEAEGHERKVFPDALIGVTRTPDPDPDTLWTAWAFTEPRGKRKRSVRKRKPP